MKKTLQFINRFIFKYTLKKNLFLWFKAEFSALSLQYSISHDPSEIIRICWFCAQETFKLLQLLSVLKRIVLFLIYLSDWMSDENTFPKNINYLKLWIKCILLSVSINVHPCWIKVFSFTIREINYVWKYSNRNSSLFLFSFSLLGGQWDLCPETAQWFI